MERIQRIGIGTKKINESVIKPPENEFDFSSDKIKHLIRLTEDLTKTIIN
jgi:hypothetical protein